MTGAFLRGVGWISLSSWLQLALSLTTFALITNRLTPESVGAYGVAALVAGFCAALLGGPFTESLQQRAELSKAETDATFWVSLVGAVVAACVLNLTAGPLSRALGSAAAEPLLRVMSLGLPLAALSGVPSSLLLRELSFARLSKVTAVVGVLASASGVAAILAGLGVWSLVIADMAAKLLGAVALFVASGYRPGPPRQLRAIAPLMRFNLHTLGTYLLGHLDRILPRVLTGALLGAQALGYLMIATRVLDLLQQIVLAPFASATMTTVARLQTDPEGLRAFIRRLYGVATLVAYPVFLGAAAIMPAAARLMAEPWRPATLALQILLLVGLRTATGAFNISILRGVGATNGPLLLLGAGVLLHLLLTPLAVGFGAAGVAAAVLVRTLATWPLGCRLLAQATGLTTREQLSLGRSALLAAALMAMSVWATVHALQAASAATQLGAALAAGVALYPAILWVCDARLRRLAPDLAGAFFMEGWRGSLRRLRAELAAPG